MFVCCECYVLSSRGLCDELITRPEDSYRLWCVVLCDQETSRMRRPWTALGRIATENKLITNAQTRLLDIYVTISYLIFLHDSVHKGLTSGNQTKVKQHKIKSVAFAYVV